MTFTQKLQALVRRQFRRRGFDIVRITPDPVRFEPHEIIWLKQLRIRTVIDVGAHQGEFVSWVRQALPDALVIAIEPLQDCARALEALAAADSRLKVVRCAAGATAGEQVIHKNAYSMASSLREMTSVHQTAFPFARVVVSDETVQVKPLDGIVAPFQLVPPVLLKIDVQGSEREVLAGAAVVLARTDIAIVEVSFAELYAGQALFEETADAFRSRGFRYSGNLWQLRDPESGVVLQADAVFVR